MAAEPLVLYSHKIDPAGVLQLLRGLAPNLEVEGEGANWTRITIRGPKKLLRKGWTLSFGHDREYYEGDDFQTQMRGMQGYICSQFPESDNTERMLLLIASFKFSITLFPSPEPDLEIDSQDPRLAIVFAVVKHLDGVIFTPSAIYDAAGRVLVGAVEDPDPAAVMPAIYREVPAISRAELPRLQGGALPDPDDVPPPSPERVARRACALAAVCGRALLEREDRKDPGDEQTRQRILKWVAEAGFGDELEPDEWKVLQLPLGAIPQRDALNSTWRLEGLGVLAWSLHLLNEIPACDELVNPGTLLPAARVLNAEGARALIDHPNLRSAEELRQMQDRIFAIHWRVTDFRVKPKAMDFVEFARTAYFGPLDLTGVRLIENDLAVGDQPISRAERDRVGAAVNAAMERHLAINWLNGGSEIYSRTDVST